MYNNRKGFIAESLEALFSKGEKMYSNRKGFIAESSLGTFHIFPCTIFHLSKGNKIISDRPHGDVPWKGFTPQC
jgi:hypothetical protein